MEGQSLGNYEVAGKLGEGGMGQVWRARDKRLNRFVAIKLLPESSVSDPTTRSRFEQEARSLAALNHSNIVAIYDVGEDNGRPYLVSELVDGELLRNLIEQGPIPIRKAITLATQIAEGLAAAHAIGIIHRDLKPENIMVTRAGEAKILDFGLAKQQSSPGQTPEKTATMALSQPGAVMGTVGYMSPEQVRAEAVDARTDIFSFGCVLYEMISGRRAFQSTSPVETMHAILKSDPPELPPASSTSSVTLPAVEGIIHRCLEKDPARRFQSASDLAFALKSLNTVSGSTSASATRIANVPTAGQRRSWKWIAVAASGVALAAIGFVGGRASNTRTEPTFQRVTFRKGSVDSARFGADGRTVLYSAHFDNGPGRTHLATPGTPESRDLGLPDNGELAAVSSRGDIAFLAGTTLQVTSVAGGQSRPLLDSVIAADYAPDGGSMAVMRGTDEHARVEYPIGTVIAPDRGYLLPALRVSPDGNRVVYSGYSGGRKVAIFLAGKGGGQPRQLAVVSGETTTNDSFPLVWTPDGSEVWFRSFDTQDPQTIFAIDMKGHVRVVTNLPSDVVLHDISRHGSALLTTNSHQFGIMGKGPGDTEERDLSCLDKSRLIGISADGTMIAASVLGDSGGPSGSIYIRKTDGSPAIRIGDGQGYSLSPDGKLVAGYDFQQNGMRRFAIFPTGPGEIRPVNPAGYDRMVAFAFLGEQRYLVGGRRPGKKWQCFSWDAAKDKMEPICAEGTLDTAMNIMSPDAKKLLTLDSKGEWVVYSTDGGGAAQPVEGIKPGEDLVGWASDNRSLYMPESVSGHAIKMVLVDAATGKRTPWKELTFTHPNEWVRGLHIKITPDGRAYGYTFGIHNSNLYVETGLLPAK